MENVQKNNEIDEEIVIDNVLIYKRTHTGDPNSDGIFGINGCMGQVRDWSYDAIIGIGVTKPWPGDGGIAEKITWIGLKPKLHKTQIARNPLVTFENFCLLDTMGLLVKDIAPKLYQHMFGGVNRRIVKDSLPPDCEPEVQAIVKLAKGWPASKGKDDIQTALNKFNSELEKHVCPSGECPSQDKTSNTEKSTKPCK